MLKLKKQAIDNYAGYLIICCCFKLLLNNNQDFFFKKLTAQSQERHLFLKLCQLHYEIYLQKRLIKNLILIHLSFLEIVLKSDLISKILYFSTQKVEYHDNFTKINITLDGNYISASYSQLSVMTVNYSGILVSPFEFYSAQLSDDQAQLSKIFETLIKQQFPDYEKATFKWGLGKIDQKMQKERYTPLYDQNAGIIDGKLVTFQQFSKLWDQRFNQNLPLIANLEFKPQQKAKTKIFDLMCYRTILMHVYKSQDLQKIDKKNIKPYQEFMSMFFSKIFLDEKKKIKYTLQAIEKGRIDILFVQQANQNLMNAVKFKFGSDYFIFRSIKGESVILVRTKRFKKIHNEKDILTNLGKDIIELLDWNNDTAIAFVDNLILFSGHLSSKKQKNVTQVATMFQSLQKMKKIYPNHHLIVGCDANTYLSKVPFFLNSFPNKENVPTTLKKRTFMQPQVNKANQLAQQCRDHLISDLQLQNSKVIGINGQSSKQIGYLPCQKHPYDHFIVASTVLIKDQ